MDNSKRNYIRRKRVYNKSMTLVHQTLELINLVKNAKMPVTEIDQLAKQYTDRIEAVCWDRRTKVTDDVYQQLVIKKTQELCSILINKHAPQVNIIRFLIQMHGNKILTDVPTAENLKQEPKLPSVSNPLPTPIFTPNNANANHVSNNILVNPDKGNNNIFSLNDDFQIRTLLRPESPSLLSSFINQDDSTDLLNNDFTESFFQTDFC